MVTECNSKYFFFFFFNMRTQIMEVDVSLSSFIYLPLRPKYKVNSVGTVQTSEKQNSDEL